MDTSTRYSDEPKPEGSGRKSVREIRAEAETSRGARKAALLWVLGEVPSDEA